MADVFVSYSRRDAGFVERLARALGERGKEAWVDVDGIRDAEVFPAALRAAIEQSDGFVFVISPDSVSSAYCAQEVEHADELNKRIVPLLLRPVSDEAVPEGIRVRNWIPFTEAAEFAPGVARVVQALDTDLAWTKEHTRWLLKALEWDGRRRERSLLLRGSELSAAEAWLDRETGKEPEPTALQREYVSASRVAAARRQRRLVGVSVAVAAVSLGLLVFALISRSQAIDARNTARSQALAADSQTQLSVDPERSILLAEAALKQAKTPEALFALRGALDASALRYRLPDAGTQTCGGFSRKPPDLAYSPDGRRLAESLCGGVIRIADRRGRIVRQIHVKGLVGSIAYSDDGSLLAAASPRGVMLIDPSRGTVTKIVPRSRRTFEIAFSPTAPVLALGGFDRLTLVNVRSGATRVLRFPSSVRGTTVTALSFSSDGKRLAVGVAAPQVGTSSGIGIVDVATGRLVAGAGADNVDDVAFSPDGTQLVSAETAGSSGGMITVLDGHTLERPRVLVRLPDVEATSVAFSPDGSEVAYGAADGTAGLVSPSTGQQIASYLGQTAAVSTLRFSPDGRLVATASADGTTRVWRAGGVELHSFRPPATVEQAKAVGRAILTLVDGGPTRGLLVQRWTDTGRPEARPVVLLPTDLADAFFLSPDGRFAGLIPVPPRNGTKASIRILDVSGGRVVRTVTPSTAPFGGQPVFSPDDSLIAMGRDVLPHGKPGPGATPEPGLVILELANGRSRTLGTTDCSAGWRSQPFSSDGALLAGGTFCGQVYVWNVATGRRLGQPFSIGGELARIAFEPDGRRIAVAGWNSAITIADARTGHIDAVLTDHTRGVDDVTWSPDGRYLASASLDDTARVWDAKTLRVLRILHHPDPVYGVSFTSDSRDLVTVDAANVVRVWDACTDCENANGLLALAASRVTRSLTPQERRTFGAGG